MLLESASQVLRERSPVYPIAEPLAEQTGARPTWRLAGEAGRPPGWALPGPLNLVKASRTLPPDASVARWSCHRLERILTEVIPSWCCRCRGTGVRVGAAQVARLRGLVARLAGFLLVMLARLLACPAFPQWPSQP